MNVQLCGPVSGRPRGESIFMFSFAKGIVSELYPDAYVFNPVNEIKVTETHENAMRECLRMLTGFTDMLVTLPGWETSKGSCLEVAVARAIGVEVVALDDMKAGRK